MRGLSPSLSGPRLFPLCLFPRRPCAAALSLLTARRLHSDVPRAVSDPSTLKERLRAAARRLCDAAAAEVRAEVSRDSEDGAAAVPPLPPAGWKVQHPAGSNYFVMTRTLRHGAQSAEAHTRRYQSIHESFLKSLRGQHEKKEKEKEKEKEKGRGRRVEIAYDANRRPVLRDTPLAAPRVVRADVHLTIFAPFRVFDPSLRDPTMDICEWSAFDVLVKKTAAQKNGATDAGPLASQAQLVEEKALCMFMRLASVNSEVRIRSVQFLSRAVAEALEAHSFFGRGEPALLELIRRRRQERLTTRRVQSLRSYDDPLLALELDGLMNNRLQFEGDGDAYRLMTECFDRGGDFSRTLCYGGPYVSELSKEMVETLLEYLQVDLGLSSELCEYVCQMQFFLEQEEYMAWLGRIQHISETVASS